MEFTSAFEKMFASGVDSLWRTIAAMPAEKLDWRPESKMRTPRELLEELLMTTTFSTDLVNTQKVPEMDESFAAPRDMKELEASYRAAVKNYVQAVKAFPDDQYETLIEMPWGKMTFLEVINYPYWNMIYHWGQISYLQTMYGDTETH